MVAIARALTLLPRRSSAAIDATGLESRHISRYYRWRNADRAQIAWPKLTVVCDLATHLWLGVDVGLGPSQDSPQFAPTLRRAVANQPLRELLADKGYDAEHNHALCRGELRIPSTIIAVKRNTNGTRGWPATPFRREMKRSKYKRRYGQRWQAESAFSRHKRLLGSALRARSWPMQQWECLMRVLTHNVLLLAAV